MNDNVETAADTCNLNVDSDEKSYVGDKDNDADKNMPTEHGHSVYCNTTSLVVNDAQLTEIKACKFGYYPVKTAYDTEEFCAIQGISVTPDGRRLFVDSCNKNIKMFSKDMTLLGCVKTRGRPLSLVCLNNEEAAVITLQKSLVILDISNGHMSIKSADAVLEEGLWNITKCKDYFAVTYPFHKRKSKFLYVNLVDRRGKIIWEGCKTLQKQGILSLPTSVACLDDKDRPLVFVADSHLNKIISINGNSGEFINEKHVVGPGSLATTYFGLISTSSNGIIIISHDLSQEKLLLSVPTDLERGPLEMAYDDSNHQLIMSYNGHVGNYIDCFQIYRGRSLCDH